MTSADRPRLTPGDFHRIPELAPNPDWSRIALTPEHNALLALINGTHHVGNIIKASGLMPAKAVPRLNELIQAGVVLLKIEAPPPERKAEIINKMTATAQASRSSEPPPDLKESLAGNLKSLPFHHLLWDIYSQKRNGVLYLSRGEERRDIFFRDGAPILVKSQKRAEYLGNILRSVGRLNASTLDHAIAVAEKDKKRLGQVLVEMKFLTPEQLDMVLRKQLEIKIIELFSWLEGAFSFRESWRPPEDIGCRDLNIQVLIYLGVSKYYPLEKKKEELQEKYYDKYIKRNPEAVWTLPPKLPARYQEIYQIIDGVRTLRQSLGLSPLNRIPTLEFLYNLYAARSLIFSDLPSEIRKREFTPDELRVIYEKLNKTSYFDRLEVHPTEVPEKIAIAYEKKIAIFAGAELKGEAAEWGRRILALLEEAHQTLMDTVERREYRRKVFDESFIHFQAGLLADQGSMALLVREEYNVAVDYFRKACDLMPGNGEYLAGLGLATFYDDLKQKKRTSTGMDFLHRAIEISPNNSIVYLYMGYLLRKVGRKEEAAQAFKKAIQLDPQETEAKTALLSLAGGG